MDNNSISDYEKILNAEIEKRLNAMEKKGYESPQRFSVRDYLIVILVVMVCLAFLIAGAFL